MAGENEIGVKVVVDPTGAQSGADASAQAIRDAADSINASLGKVTTASNSTAAAIRSNFAGVEQQLNGMQSTMDQIAARVTASGQAIVATLNQIPAAGNNARNGLNGVGHAAAGVRRELLVLGHEAMTGNWTRFGGSILVLGERMDWLRYLTGVTGVALGLTAAAIATVAVAAIKGAAEMHTLNNELALTGNAAGLTQDRYLEMASAIQAANAKLTMGEARGAVGAVAATGMFGPAAMQAVSAAVAEISRLSGENEKKVAEDFAKMNESVFKWANTNKEALNLVTAAEAEYARHLEETGQKEEAEIYISERVSARLSQVQQDLGYLPSLWNEVTKAASMAWDAMMGIGRPDTLSTQIAKLEERKKALQDTSGIGANELDALGGGVGLNMGDTVAGLNNQIAALQKLKKAQDDKATADAKQAQANREGKQASAEMDKQLEQLKSRNLLEEEWQKHLAEEKKSRDNGGTVFTPQQETAYRAYLEKKYNDHAAKPKTLTSGAAGAVDRATDNGELALLKDKLSNEQQELTRSYKANEITLQAYYQRRMEIVKQGMQAEIDVANRGVTNAQSAAQYAKSPDQQAQAQARIVQAKNRVALLNQQLAEQEKGLTEEMNQQAKLQENKLSTIKIQSNEQKGLSEIQQQQTLAAAQVALGNSTHKQLLQQEVQFENQRYQLEVQALNERMALEDLSVTQKAELQAKLETMEQTHQQKLTELAVQGAEEQAKPQQQMYQSIESDFVTFFDSIASGTKSIKQAFLDLAQSIEKTLTQALAKGFVNDLLGAGGSAGSPGLLGGMLKSVTGAMFGNDGGANGGTNGEASGGLAQAWGKLMGMVGQGMGGMGGGGGSMMGGFSSLFGSSMGSAGAEAGSFGFTTGLEGTGSAVASGALADGSSEGMSALMGLAAYAKGTNYVPETGLAMLHKGEAVVPAAYNNSGGGGGRSMSAKIQNNFYMPQNYDLRTQNQVAMAAGGGIQTAMRRNG